MHLRRAVHLTLLVGSLVALPWVASSCGFFGGTCGDFCDFEIDCVGETSCGQELTESQRPECLKACNKASEELSDAEDKLLENCMSCVGKLDDDHKCEAVDDHCDDCSRLVASADDFFQTFFDEMGDNYCYSYDYARPGIKSEP